ncbi:MAG: 2-C-methyl-D-erythritol 4-phosphate cytidylyltransferase [Prevotellaceae bacterium]|nr:2-C-methyl-D-erythritol 4-phosphate cytidylyltransferase [Prevotellaceae bacterium]
MDKYAIIVAGGKGRRMGAALPKQFLPIGGLPILMRTVSAFLAADPKTHVILVIPEDCQDLWQELCRQHAFEPQCGLACGADSRFRSVAKGLALVPDQGDVLVAVHDGVRPFASPQLINRCFAVAESEGSAIPVIPVVETVRQISPEGGSHVVDREAYRLVQTPQVFRAKLLKEAYCQAYQPSFTDDASVVEHMGHNVTLVEGERGNIKITTPTDLALAEYLCRE